MCLRRRLQLITQARCVCSDRGSASVSLRTGMLAHGCCWATLATKRSCSSDSLTWCVVVRVVWSCVSCCRSSRNENALSICYRVAILSQPWRHDRQSLFLLIITIIDMIVMIVITIDIVMIKIMISLWIMRR